MDFRGQKLAERMYQVILVIAGIIAFLAGYLSGSFDTMSYVFTCGVIVAVILCVPDWNYFNQHPVKWLPIDEDHPDWETKYKPQMEAKGGAKGRKQERGRGAWAAGVTSAMTDAMCMLRCTPLSLGVRA